MISVSNFAKAIAYIAVGIGILASYLVLGLYVLGRALLFFPVQAVRRIWQRNRRLVGPVRESYAAGS